MGMPFYCSPDRTVYLESPFLEALWKKGWSVGLQVIVAHEIGHYVQDSSGVHATAQPIRTGQVYSVDLELGADCFGGIWAGDAFRRGTVTHDSLNEAWDISYASGDAADTPWYARDAHGTPRQRSNAFMLGVRGQ